MELIHDLQMATGEKAPVRERLSNCNVVWGVVSSDALLARALRSNEFTVSPVAAELLP
jgi:hypothetical protein